MIEIKEQSLTEGIKKNIYEGFSRHTTLVTGHDEKLTLLLLLAWKKLCLLESL